VNNGNKQVIEALIFASDFPLSVKKICQIIEDVTEEEAEELIEELRKNYTNAEHGFFLQKTAGGYEFVTRAEYRVWINRLMAGRRKNRLSRAALETAAIIAYHQPVTRAGIEKIRGVDSGGTLRTLLDRSLITITGREKAPGRPLIYKTSEEFLRYFGIDSVIDLPRLEEIEEIIHHGGEQTGVSFEQLSFESGDSLPEEVQRTD